MIIAFDISERLAAAHRIQGQNPNLLIITFNQSFKFLTSKRCCQGKNSLHCIYGQIKIIMKNTSCSSKNAMLTYQIIQSWHPKDIQSRRWFYAVICNWPSRSALNIFWTCSFPDFKNFTGHFILSNKIKHDLKMQEPRWQLSIKTRKLRNTD